MYISIVSSKEAADTLYNIWKTRKAPAGIHLTEDDMTFISETLAILDYPQYESILQRQRESIHDADRNAKLAFLLPSLSNDVAVRDSFFNSLSDEKNRT